MPLTQYNAGSHEMNDDNLFHWDAIRHEIARDVETARMKIKHIKRAMSNNYSHDDDHSTASSI